MESVSFTFSLAQTQTCANPVAHHTALQRVRSPTSEIALLRALRCVEQSAVASSSRPRAALLVVHAGDLYLVRILSLSEQISSMMALELS